jgi:predicted dehydrogenase
MKNISRRNFVTVAGAAGAAILTGQGQPGFSVMSDSDPREHKLTGKKIRVGIIGCGSVMNCCYTPHLLSSEFAEIVSVCDIKPDRAKAASEKFGIAAWYDHIDKMLSGVDFDLLVNLTDMQEHGRLNRIALLAGKNVWSEKPMAGTYSEGRDLLDLAISRKLRIWGAPAVVNSPQFAFMSGVIGRSELGRVAAAHAHYGHTGPDWSAFFYEEKGGSMPDLGVYNIATLTGLLGPAKRIMAMTNIITPERTVGDKGKIKVMAEDNAQILLEHGSGALSHIMCGFNYFDPYGHEGAGQDRPTISVFGSEGNMNLIGYDWHPIRVEMATIKEPSTRRVATETGTYLWQEGASVICESLVKGIEPLINAEHALHVLEIIEGARESQRTGKRIGLKSSFRWPVV